MLITKEASENSIVQVQHFPAPAAGPTPHPAPDTGTVASPQPALTANPYGISDQVVRGSARSAGERMSADMSTALQKFYNAALGDDLRVAGDPSQSIDNRLVHAEIAGATVLSLAGGPESLGLKLAAKETL